MKGKTMTRNKEYVIRWKQETHGLSYVEAVSVEGAREKARQDKDTGFQELDEKRFWVIDLIQEVEGDK